MKYLNFIYLYFSHSYMFNFLYKSNNYFYFLECQDQFEQLLSQPEEMSYSSPAASIASVSSIASTFVDDIYAQVKGRERHGRVRGYGFGVSHTLVFGSSSTRQLRSTLSAYLENAQGMLRVAKQKFTIATKTFEEKLVEVQRKTRE